MQDRLGAWARAAARAGTMRRRLKIARFGDNMREVAVTEGDKVEAQMRLGYRVNGYGVGDLVAMRARRRRRRGRRPVRGYEERYDVAPALRQGGARHESLRDAARIEVGCARSSRRAASKASPTPSRICTAWSSCPASPSQRLMADGYGFGGEGDWKTAALVRAMKVMAAGLPGGTSFMEDYTYHLEPERAAGARRAHARNLPIDRRRAGRRSKFIRSASAAKRTRCGWCSTRRPARRSTSRSIDMGNRFRLHASTRSTWWRRDEPLPKLPVARALWSPQPDLKTAAAAWILAGGAHHTGFSAALRVEHIADLAEMAELELVRHRRPRTTVGELKKELRGANAVYDR